MDEENKIMAVRRKRKINNNQESGFSFIELIIVLLIISILAVASIPQIQRNLQLYRLETATGLLSNRLTESRITAVKHNKASWVEISPSRVIGIWTTNALNEPIQSKLAVTLPDNISIDSTSSSRITFTSLGRNQANTSSIIRLRLTNTNFCRTVIVSAIGHVTSGGC